MIKKHAPLTLLASALLLGGCAVEAGWDARSDEYGVATRANFVAQDAYNSAAARLLNLSKDFQAKAQDTVTFAFDKATLDENARKALDTQATWLLAHPNVRMTIVGHTDKVGSEGYNRGLGLRRARAVLRYLNSKGVSRRRLSAIASRGETEPVVDTAERERRNRRAVTSVSGYARKYVGTGLDGEYAARVYDQYQAGTTRISDAQSNDLN